VHPYLSEKTVRQHQADLRALAAGRGHPGNAAYAAQARQARGHQGHQHMIRRRAGWALVSLGLRLAYAAGED
jgi:hypothetical protein